MSPRRRAPTGPGPRAALRLAVAALSLLLCLAFGLAPHAARADGAAVAKYLESIAALEMLLEEREGLHGQLFGAMSAERAALDRLTKTEQWLAELIRDQRARSAQLERLPSEVAALEAHLPPLEQELARLTRRIEAQERWMHGMEAPRVWSVRGYEAALEAYERLDAEAEHLRGSLEEIRGSAAAVVADLGRLNTEIGAYEKQADALSRQVGAMRSRAIAASARLGALQTRGVELAAEVAALFEQLQEAGYPAGVAAASTGLPPVPEPLTWPAGPAPAYVLPWGASAAALRAREPLQLDQAGLAGLASELALDRSQWVMPASGVVTTPYGDSTPYQAAHWAIDLGTRLYEPVRAAADGVVEFAGLAAGDNRLASYGMVVYLRHGERVTTLYAHLDDRAHGLQVQQGQAVLKGQVIGYVGLTGYSTGPHLHFELRIDNQPVDPALVVGSQRQPALAAGQVPAAPAPVAPAAPAAPPRPAVLANRP